jgi:deoxyribodipyrimidine photolyase
MENYEDITLDDFEESEEGKKEFTLDTPEKVDWAIEQIIDEQKRFELYEQAINGKIEKLKCELVNEKEASGHRTSWLRFKLGEYLQRDDVPAKNTKTQLSLKMPSGTIKYIKSKSEFIKDDDVLLKFCKENNSEFIKTKESVNWKDFKTTLNIVGNDVFNADGVIVDGITIEDTVPKVEVK